VFNVRSLMEQISRRSAEVSGKLNLLLLRDTLKRRDILTVVEKIEELAKIAKKLREEAKL